MSINIESTPEIESLANLQQQKASLEGRMQKAQYTFENIATPGFTDQSRFRLDMSDPYEYSENLDRVTRIQVRLLDKTIPYYQSQLSAINHRIEVIGASETLNVIEERYQRIQERVSRGIPVPQEVLSPLEVEIERLRSIVNNTQEGSIDGVAEDISEKDDETDEIVDTDTTEPGSEDTSRPEYELDLSEQAMFIRLIKERTDKPIKIDDKYRLFDMQLHVKRALQIMEEATSGVSLENLDDVALIELKTRTLSKIAEVLMGEDPNQAIEALDPAQATIFRWLYVKDSRPKRGASIRFFSENPERFSPLVKDFFRAQSTKVEKPINRNGQEPVSTPDIVGLPLSVDQMFALEVCMTDLSVSVRDLGETLGLSESLSEDPAQVLAELKLAVELLKVRINNNTANQEEIGLWSIIDALTCQGQSIEAIILGKN